MRDRLHILTDILAKLRCTLACLTDALTDLCRTLAGLPHSLGCIIFSHDPRCCRRTAIAKQQLLSVFSKKQPHCQRRDLHQ